MVNSAAALAVQNSSGAVDLRRQHTGGSVIALPRTGTRCVAEAPLRVLVTGADGMLGSAIAAEVWSGRHPHLSVTFVHGADADLSDPFQVAVLLASSAPDVVVHCGAGVGGEAARAADETASLLASLAVDAAVLRAAMDAGVTRLVYLGSTHNDASTAAATLASSRVCQLASAERGLAYRSVVASDLYGPGDDFSGDRPHLVAAALSQVHAAHLAGDPTVATHLDGAARRAVTFVGDVATWLVGVLPRLEELPAVLHLSGIDRSVAEHYEAARVVVGYEGDVVHAGEHSIGIPHPRADPSLAPRFGWSPSTAPEAGMRAAYQDLMAAEALA